MLHLKGIISKVVANTGWNLLGLLLPLLAAVVAIPLLINHIGTERFGILSLVWVCIGYFALFDLGLGRAVTKQVSELESQGGHEGELVSLCVTTSVIAALMGLLGGAIVVIAAFALPASIWTSFPQEVQDELQGTLVWVGICIPIVVLTAVFKGMLEGVQHFRVLNLIRGPAGALFFALPAAASIYSPSLVWAAGMTVVARGVMLHAHLLACRSMLILDKNNFSMRWVRPLFEFGGWFTVSNVIGPVIVYMDRFVIAAILPFSSLAFYTAPFEVVSKVLNIPVALTAALFPALNKINAADTTAAERLKVIAQAIVFVVMTVIVVIGVGFTRDFLAIWIGDEFAEQSTRVMQVLLVGFAFNALAQVTYVSLQSEDQTRIVAYLHLCELPLYGILLWVLIENFGINGAALSWAIRSLLDWIFLEAILYRVVRSKKIQRS